MTEFAQLKNTSWASTGQPIHSLPIAIQPDTLLEYLYTHYSLSALQSMLDAPPANAMLLAWGITGDVFFYELRKAIEFVKND